MRAYRIIEGVEPGKPLPDDAWLRLGDAATWAGVQRYTVQRWVDAGLVAAVDETSAGRYGKRILVSTDSLNTMERPRTGRPPKS